MKIDVFFTEATKVADGEAEVFTTWFPRGDPDLHLVARDSKGVLVYFPGLRHPAEDKKLGAPGLVGYYINPKVGGQRNPFGWVDHIDVLDSIKHPDAMDGFTVRLDQVPSQVHRLDVVVVENGVVIEWPMSLVRDGRDWRCVSRPGFYPSDFTRVDEVVLLK